LLFLFEKGIIMVFIDLRELGFRIFMEWWIHNAFFLLMIDRSRIHFFDLWIGGFKMHFFNVLIGESRMLILTYGMMDP